MNDIFSAAPQELEAAIDRDPPRAKAERDVARQSQKAARGRRNDSRYMNGIFSAAPRSSKPRSTATRRAQRRNAASTAKAKKPRGGGATIAAT